MIVSQSIRYGYQHARDIGIIEPRSSSHKNFEKNKFFFPEMFFVCIIYRTPYLGVGLGIENRSEQGTLKLYSTSSRIVLLANLSAISLPRMPQCKEAHIKLTLLLNLASSIRTLVYKIIILSSRIL